MSSLDGTDPLEISLSARAIEIIELVEDSATEDWKFKKVGAFDHPYPTTKIMWRPDIEGTAKDQVATTGDYLRLWNVSTNGITEAHVFNNNKDTEYCAPLTSFDWCAIFLSFFLALLRRM